MTPKHTVIDLFCGCGGLSTGLSLAGFKVIAGIDLEEKYICSFERNFPEAKALRWDVAERTPKQLLDEVGLQVGELDLLAGGPPCQGFSKNVPRSQRRADLDNNKLVSRFIAYCEQIRPKAVLMENVAEMRNGYERTYTEEVTQRLNNAGYKVAHAVLTAADYGVPQRRRRAFFLAQRNGNEPRIPGPSHSHPKTNAGLFAAPKHVTVWEAIGDLPGLQHGEGESHTGYTCAPQNEFQSWAREGCTATTNHIARRLADTQFARLAALKPGQGLKDLPPKLRVKGGYSGAYGRLTKDMVCATITRWVFHPGSGRWGHPVDTRVLTIREAARIQSFPDKFEFVGTYIQQAGQVGNAVPPLLAYQLGRSMLQDLKPSKHPRVQQVD